MAGPRLALILFGALLVVALLPPVSAHEAFTAGKYSIEVGWQYEPAVADQPNAVLIKVIDTSAGGEGAPVSDGVALTPELAFGSDTKTLALSGSDESPGEYFGPVLPTKAGDYTLHITGTVNGVQVDHTTKMESVMAPSDEAFPVSHGTVRELQDIQSMLWFASAAAGVLAVLALILAIAALARKPKAAPVAPRPPTMGTPVRMAAAPGTPIRRAPPPPGRI